MTERFDLFLSYSRNDRDAAALLHAQLEGAGLSVFKDDQNIRWSDLWLNRLQDAVDGCGAFVVLVVRDGVKRWIGAETKVALSRSFSLHDDAERLPIFPILLDGIAPDTLPAFLRLFQATPWNGAEPLPDDLLDQIRTRKIADQTATFEGCPFVGLAAYRIDQAHLFFGRQKETLDALACFFDIRPGRPAVRWLEINGNSGSGKSSLMQAGLLPLVEKGWLWRPGGRYETWTRIGPMMPGAHPIEMLGECLAQAFNARMGDVVQELRQGDDALRYWLRGRKQDDTAFLLAIDQFEELFTFADPDERRRFDGLLATALEDADCPLFIISTVRSDFLDRFAEDLPRLVSVQNRLGRTWKLAPIGNEALREVIEGPARLAGLEVGEIKEAMIAEARDEPGALPVIENALHYLWEQREGNHLSGRLFTEHGGLAGILSRSADGLLGSLGPERPQALELLFCLVQVDPEGRRHTRRRMPLGEAIAVAGGGEAGRRLITRLAGERARDGSHSGGPLRLITVTEEGSDKANAGGGRWVNLIHETLIRSKGMDAAGKPQPYWPTLWAYIENNKERAARRERLQLMSREWKAERAARRERLQLMSREWKDRRGVSRLFGLAGWSSLFGFRGLAAPGSLERRYLGWSRARALVEIALVASAVFLVVEDLFWTTAWNAPVTALLTRWPYMLGIAELPRPDFVPIHTGNYDMGAEDLSYTRPVHPVTITQPFDMRKFEVTFSEWDACVADGGCPVWPFDHGWGRGRRPVIGVSWHDAQKYVDWLSRQLNTECRLPSEAEWEYAARAGTTTAYALPAPDGTDDIAGAGLANCEGCGGEWDGKDRTAPVGSFQPNAWGLHDMHGNVMEWVADCWHENYDGASDDGRARREEDGRVCEKVVMRGGSWFHNKSKARLAFRDWYPPSDQADNSFGFRVVCVPSSRSDH